MKKLEHVEDYKADERVTYRGVRKSEKGNDIWGTQGSGSHYSIPSLT